MRRIITRDKHVIRFSKTDWPCPFEWCMSLCIWFYNTVSQEKRQLSFRSTREQKELFIGRMNLYTKTNSEGLDDKAIADFITSLFNGINSQTYNTPVDLFIEDFLNKTYPQLQPFQFLSLLSLIKEYIDAATNKKLLEYTPAKIRTANIILSPSIVFSSGISWLWYQPSF